MYIRYIALFVLLILIEFSDTLGKSGNRPDDLTLPRNEILRAQPTGEQRKCGRDRHMDHKGKCGIMRKSQHHIHPDDLPKPLSQLLIGPPTAQQRKCDRGQRFDEYGICRIIF